jgi:hypothetical protein
MCTTCFAAFGSLVGVALVAKAGGLAGIKAAAGVVGAKLLLLFR